MQIDILTLFPHMFDGPFSESIINRGQNKGYIKINIHDLREYAFDKHHTTDDRPYGGGPGMVMMVEPIHKALQAIKLPGTNHQGQITVLTSASGIKFDQSKARAYSSLDQLIIIAGHYEGVDQRVVDHLVDETVSIGDYVLTGGELPAMVITDAVVRLIPGVLGSPESLDEESHTNPGVLEYPHYTRPETYNNWNVPKELISGNHATINKWRQEKLKKTT